jgi:hypothetical protein
LHEVTALDVRIPVRFTGEPPPRIVEELLRPWADAGSLRPGSETGPEVRLETVTEANLPERAASLSSFVTFAALEQLRGRELLLHAAGVADEDGRVVAFVGPSGRGKTTASRSLGTGLGYVSDETVAVAASGAVRAYRKPLSVIVEGVPHKRQMAPSELGLLPLPAAPLELAAIVLLDRSPDAGQEAYLEPVSLCMAIAELVPQVSYIADLPSPLQFIARLVAPLGGVKRIRYSEAETLAAAMPQILGPVSPAPPWRPVLPEGAPRDRPYRTMPVIDAIESEGCTAVLLEGGRLRVLDGIGPGLWRAVCQGRSFDEIVDDVIDEFGAPPEGRAADVIAGALDELCSHGLFRGAADA